MLKTSTVQFLKSLQKNNNKPWFENHRTDYDNAKADFSSFVQQVIGKHGKKDLEIQTLAAKDCLFRINRDVRFSKNKAPYKNNFGASIKRGGKKSMAAGYYFQVEPGNSFAGGGIWMPEAPDLKKIRQEVDYNFKEFKSLLQSKKFKSVYGDLLHGSEYELSRVPKGYETDNPAADYLKMKSFVAKFGLADADLSSKDLLKNTLTAFEALRPVLEFINRGLGEIES